MITPAHTLLASRLPSNQEFVLKYCPFFSMNPGPSGSNALYQFRANDLYDPDFTSTGTQPRGFDQIMALYNHFTVVASRARVHISQPTLTGTGNQFCVIALVGASSDFNTTTTLSDYVECVEKNRMDWGIVGTSSNSRSVMFTSKWINFNAKQFFGKKPDVLYADFQGSASASPVEQAFFNVMVGAWDGSSDTDVLRCFIEIEYTARFSEPKPLPAS